MLSIAHLNQLEADGLISLSQVIPEPAYWFRHALVQETAYQSLVRQDRRELHLAAAEVLEVIFQDKLEEQAPLLAHHFSLGGDDQRALQYYKIAADAAFRRYANSEAVLHYLSALRISNKPDISFSIPPQTWQDLYLNLGYAYQQLLNYEMALDTFQRLENLGRMLENSRLELEAILAQAVIYSTPTPKFNTELSEVITTRALD